MLEIATGLLQPAINLGLSEQDFWEMTVAEVERYVEGAKWRLQSQASLDYTLANLINTGIASMFDESVKMPDLEEAYPTLFDAEIAQKREQEKCIRESQNRFLVMAMAINQARRADHDNRRTESKDNT